jgi:hypothetical protein
MQLASKPTMTLGKYRHYKGNEYQVLDLVLHSETEEWMVLYRPLYGDGYLWVRPYSMFLERVQLADESWVDRFALITE